MTLTWDKSVPVSRGDVGAGSERTAKVSFHCASEAPPSHDAQSLAAAARPVVRPSMNTHCSDFAFHLLLTRIM